MTWLSSAVTMPSRDVSASVDRGECETMLGCDLNRCLDVTGHC